MDIIIPMAKPLIGEEEKRAVSEVLDSGMLAQGSKVAEFEKAFASFIGVRHAIAVSSGTTALHTAILAHNIKPGDEIITSPFSFIASANAIRMTGAKPVFVDIDEKTFNINPDLIEAAVTPRTKAVLPVHIFGRSCNMEKIMAIAVKHTLIIIEDACQAHGAVFKCKKVGSFGTGCFSFYPTKNITTGEGGMITTNNDSVAEKARRIINHGSGYGSEKKYEHNSLGYNYRMTDIAAAIGLEQLRKLERFNERRRWNARYLNENLNPLSGVITPEIDNSHAVHQYTLRVTAEFAITREKLQEFLREKGIATSIFYPVPIHQQKSYNKYVHLSFPVAEKAAKEVLSLPAHPALGSGDMQKITDAFREIKINGGIY